MKRIRSLIVANFCWRGRLNRSSFYISIGLFYLLGLLALPLQVVQSVAAARDATSLLVVLNGLLVVVGVVMAWFMHAAVVALISRIPLSDQKTILLSLILGFVVAAPFLIWGAVEIFCLRGRQDANRYGPDPLATAETNTLVAQPIE